jgi:gamma-glutamylcyclotransferase
MPARFHYFAYGSNLRTVRLLERTPSATVVGTGKLDRHELRWHKAASDGSGKCDVVQTSDPTRYVLGVVYEISAHEKPVLDAAEALGTGYAQKEVHVQMSDGVMLAQLYYALRIDPHAVPYDWYKALVVTGAKEHGLDPDYVQRLEATRCVPDHDSLRSARHFALAHHGGPPLPRSTPPF